MAAKKPAKVRAATSYQHVLATACPRKPRLIPMRQILNIGFLPVLIDIGPKAMPDIA